MSGKGWISIHRKMLDNPIVCKDSDHMAVWVYLLLNATHTEYPALFSGNKITLQPGQLLTGRKSISEKLNISESKVQRILKTFENEQQIEQQNGNKNRLITVVSWSEYQDSEHQNEQQLNNKRTTTEQQVNTNNNVNNKNNENKGNKKKSIPKIKFAEFVSLSQEEYDKLLSSHGEEKTKRMIEILDNYKGANNKKYASDYRAILNWVVKRVEEEGQRGGYKPTESFTGRQTAASQHNTNGSKVSGANGQQITDPRYASGSGTSAQSSGGLPAPSKYNEFVRR